MQLSVEHLPKIDLHLHLDGAIAAETALDLAHKSCIDLGVDTADELRQRMQAGPECKSLTQFLECFDTVYPVLAIPGCLSRVATELAHSLKNQRHIYAEVRFAPIFASAELQKGGGPSAGQEAFDEDKAAAEMLTETLGVLAAFQSACEPDFEINLILCIMRESSPLQARLTWELVEALLPDWGPLAPTGNRRMVGLDLAGDESKYSGREHADFFREAAWRGLGITVHAGEAAGPTSVLEALSIFGARRLGHGIRAREDGHLLDRLIREQIPLEVCPTSNMRTGLTESKAHPFTELLRRGAAVTLNTDDPAICPTDMTTEWNYVLRSGNLRPPEVRRVLENSVRAAFAGAATKVRLMQNIHRFFNE